MSCGRKPREYAKLEDRGGGGTTSASLAYPGLALRRAAASLARRSRRLVAHERCCQGAGEEEVRRVGCRYPGGRGRVLLRILLRLRFWRGCGDAGYRRPRPRQLLGG